MFAGTVLLGLLTAAAAAWFVSLMSGGAEQHGT